LKSLTILILTLFVSCTSHKEKKENSIPGYTPEKGAPLDKERSDKLVEDSLLIPAFELK
jgi:hypothetical protein